MNNSTIYLKDIFYGKLYRKPWFLFLSFVLIILFSSFFINFVNLPYFYFKFMNGNLLEYKEECFIAPKGWVIGSKKHNKENKEHYILMNFNSEKERVIHFMYDSNASVQSFVGYPVVEAGEEYKAYDLSNVFSDDSMRYWLYSFSDNYVVAGRSIEKIRLFYERLSGC